MIFETKSAENFFESALQYLHGEDIPVNENDLYEIIYEPMRKEWATYEYKDVSPYLDTSPREDVLDLVSQFFLGRHWPTYADKVNMHEFSDSLLKAIDDRNKLVDNTKESV